MSVRSLSRLHRDQAALLAEYRLGSDAEEPARTAESVAPVTTFGRVTAMVYYDPVHGPHVRVKPYVYAGSPAYPAPTELPDQIARPTPNRTVFNYTLDEFVEIRTVRGARLAVKFN
jgi:hypothetical protein